MALRGARYRPVGSRLRGLSLRARILWLVLGVGVFPALLILVATTLSAVGAMRNFVLEQGQESAAGAATAVAQELTEEVEHLRDLAHTIAIVGIEGRGASAELIGRLPFWARHPGAAVFYIERGRVTGRWTSAGFSAEHATLPLALHRLIAEREGESLFAVDAPGLGSEELVLWLLAAVPETDNHPSGWLACELSPGLLLRRAGGKLAEGDVPLYLATSSGSLMGVDPDDQGRLKKLIEEKGGVFSSTRGYMEDRFARSEAFAFARVPSALPGPGGGMLYVVRRVEFDEATVNLFYVFWKIALVGLVCFLLLAVFGAWFSTRLVEPILQLRASFNRLELGDLDHRVELHTGDEVEQLANSMNRMARALQHTYRSLADKLLELDEQTKQLALTHDIANSLNQSLDMKTLFADITRQIRQLVSADFVSLGLTSEKSPDRVELVYVWPSDAAAKRGMHFQVQGSLTASCLGGENLGLFQLADNAGTPEEELLAGMNLCSLLLLPLMTPSRELTGVLLVADSDPELFTQHEVEILRRVSLSLAIAVEHGRLYAHQAAFATELERQVEERTAALRQAQEQLLVAEKLAATGEMAANIAHEINNPLSIIKNYLSLHSSQLLKPTLDAQGAESLREGMNIIGEEIDRIARIVEQLRRVQSPIKPPVRVTDINQELAHLITLYRHTSAQKSLDIRESYDPKLEPMALCADYFRQIIINLIRNAHDATGPGGSIEILTVASQPDAGHLTVMVRDTGTGIPEDVIKKIFNPFFTTKREGKGSGLGLSVSYGLARSMGGRIEVKSYLGKGTEFQIILPTSPPPTEAAPEEAPESGMTREGERIIIG